MTRYARTEPQPPPAEDEWYGSLCGQCGRDMALDGDGTCASCGTDPCGEHIDGVLRELDATAVELEEARRQRLASLIDLARARDELAERQQEVDTYKDALAMAKAKGGVAPHLSEGELSVSATGGTVQLSFSAAVTGIGMNPERARVLADSLRKYADIGDAQGQVLKG